MRIGRSVRSLCSGGALLLCLLLALVAPAQAQQNVYAVNGVAVDVTAETAAGARDIAISQAQNEALQRLFQRLVLDEDLPRLAQSPTLRAQDYVQDFAVDNERSSPGRYLADFNIRFKSRPVRDLFRQVGVRFAETPSKPMLVLPLFDADGAKLLWEDPNPWREAWAARDPNAGLVPLVTPLGDLTDLAAINAQQVLAGDLERLAVMSGRYGTKGVLIAQAALGGDPDQGTSTVVVQVSRLEGEVVSSFPPAGYTQQPGEAVPDLFTRAVDGVAQLEQAGWKIDNQLNFALQRRIAVRVPITQLGDWLAVKRRLANVAPVLSVELSYMRRDQAQINLSFVGEDEQLVRAMAQSDLALTRQLPDTGFGAPPTLSQTLDTVTGDAYGATLAATDTWELRLGAPPAAAATPTSGGGWSTTTPGTAAPSLTTPTTSGATILETAPSSDGSVERLEVLPQAE